VLFRDDYGVHLGGWRQQSDSLLVRFRGYGFWWDLGFVGRPDSLRGWSEVRTHRGFYEHATVSARTKPCEPRRAA
jgi:hypothetical protein